MTITRYAVGEDGKTAYQRLKGRKFNAKIHKVGENAHGIKNPKAKEQISQTLDGKREYG